MLFSESTQFSQVNYQKQEFQAEDSNFGKHSVDQNGEEKNFKYLYSPHLRFQFYFLLTFPRLDFDFFTLISEQRQHSARHGSHGRKFEHRLRKHKRKPTPRLSKASKLYKL